MNRIGWENSFFGKHKLSYIFDLRGNRDPAHRVGIHGSLAHAGV